MLLILSRAICRLTARTCPVGRLRLEFPVWVLRGSTDTINPGLSADPQHQNEAPPPYPPRELFRRPAFAVLLATTASVTITVQHELQQYLRADLTTRFYNYFLYRTHVIYLLFCFGATLDCAQGLLVADLRCQGSNSDLLHVRWASGLLIYLPSSRTHVFFKWRENISYLIRKVALWFKCLRTKKKHHFLGLEQ